jgi:predicted dienelactone hydrolase
MNGFKMMADSYRHEGNEKEARIFDFLATCDDNDINTLANSTAFNTIIKAYTKQACKEAGLDEAMQDKVLNNLRFVLSEQTAEDVLRGCGYGN